MTDGLSAEALQLLLDSGKELADLQAIEDDADAVIGFVVPDGHNSFRALDLADVREARRRELDQAPARVTGTVQVESLDALVAYTTWHTGGTAPAAHITRAGVVTVILNPPIPGGPSYADHRVILQPTLHPQWQAWLGSDRKPMSQTDFAEFVEDRGSTFVKPTQADMLEVAQTLTINRDVRFTGKTNIQSGMLSAAYTEEETTGAGKTGELTIPARFGLQIPVWLGANVAVEMRARLRFRLKDRQPVLHYILDDLADVQLAAAAALRANVVAALDGLTSALIDGPAPQYGS